MVYERNLWRHAALRNPFIQKKILSDLRLILLGEMEIPSYVEIKSPTGEKLGRKQRIQTRMEHLEELHALINLLIQKRIESVTLGGEWSEQDAARQQDAHEHIAHILEEISLELEPLIVAFKSAQKEHIPQTYKQAEFSKLLMHFGQTPEEHAEQMHYALVHFNEWLKSRTNITNANLRLVISIAKKYIRRRRPFLDLIQDGNVGLIRGVDKFNPDLGNKISTYATWWIHQKIRREAKINSRPIRLPEHMNALAEKIYNYEKEYTQINGGGVLDDQMIAEALSETVVHVATTRKAIHRVTSLDYTVAGKSDDEFCLRSLYPDTREVSPEWGAEMALIRDAIRTTLLSLPERDQAIAIERFGLGFRIENRNGTISLINDEDSYGQDKTLEEVAGCESTHLPHNEEVEETDESEDSVTRERIRQLQERIFKKFYAHDHPMRESLYRIVRELLGLRKQPQKRSNGHAASLPEGNDSDNPALQYSLTQLSLPTRVVNTLEENGIFLVKDVLACTNADLFSFNGIAHNSIHLIDTALETVGLIRLKGNMKLRKKGASVQIQG